MQPNATCIKICVCSQKKFTTDFLTKKQKKNKGEVPQYYVEGTHPAAPFSYLAEPNGSFFIPFSKEVTQNVREFRLENRS